MNQRVSSFIRGWNTVNLVNSNDFIRIQENIITPRRRVQLTAGASDAAKRSGAASGASACWVPIYVMGSNVQRQPILWVQCSYGSYGTPLIVNLLPEIFLHSSHESCAAKISTCFTPLRL